MRVKKSKKPGVAPEVDDVPPSEEAVRAAEEMSAEIAEALRKLQETMDAYPEGFVPCTPAVRVDLPNYEAKHLHGGELYALELKGRVSMKDPKTFVARVQKMYGANLVSWKRIYKNQHIVLFFNRYVEETQVVTLSDGNTVVLRRNPDDVLALRVNLGGNPAVKQFYFNYQGELQDIADMLDIVSRACREALHRKGVYYSPNIILS